MAKLLLLDERIEGSPPWQELTATCLINTFLHIDSILDWVIARTRDDGPHILYIVAPSTAGAVLLGREGIRADNVNKWSRVRGRLEHLAIVACRPARRVLSLRREDEIVWALGAEAAGLCAELAGCTEATVSVIDADHGNRYSHYLVTHPERWDGAVCTWSPDGSRHRYSARVSRCAGDG